MELYIDDRLADMDERTEVAVSVSVASITNPEYGRTGYTKSVSIPMTAANRAIMGDCEQVAARDRFNDIRHSARLEHDGCVIMEGGIILTSCEKGPGAGRYVFNIIGNGKRWAEHAADNTLASLMADYSATLTATEIVGSWTEAVPVRWLPVQRQRYEPHNSPQGVTAAVRVLSAADYHPFLHLRTVMHAIFSEAGYTLKSEFVDSHYFDTLYMSGNYPEHDTSILRMRMDFLAARFEAAEAVADANGMVYADPLNVHNSIGNIVDTADPCEESGGMVLPEVFSRGECFGRDGERVRFVPPYGVSVGFEYRLRYVTDFRMSDRERLTGFDTVYLGGGQLHSFRIPNTFPDRRGEFCGGKEFKCVVFDYADGEEYRLVADRTDGGAGQECIMARMERRAAAVDAPVGGTYSGLRMQKKEADGTWSPYEGEWALYDGYVNDTGTVEVEVVLRSAAEEVTPGSPKYFDDIYFGGAEAGMAFLLEDAEVRPVFQPHPAAGDRVTFAEVAAHGISRMEVINGVREMFGLCFYTDGLEKVVYAEPRKMFYRDDVVVDWSDRVDFSRPLSLSEIALDVPSVLAWQYAGGDGASAEFNMENGGRLGRWSVVLEGQCSVSQSKVYQNSLFTTSVGIDGVLPEAMSAALVGAGDMASAEERVDSLDFPAKVVHYVGMKPLPDGELWGWPGFGRSYPYLAFHAPGGAEDAEAPLSAAGEASDAVRLPMEGFTLCYEDRDGVQGLHVWWDGLVESYERGLRLEAWLRLCPEDIEALVRPNYMKKDFRARFRLHIDGEWSDWRLEEVCDYNPGAAATRCIFVKAD